MPPTPVWVEPIASILKALRSCNATLPEALRLQLGAARKTVDPANDRLAASVLGRKYSSLKRFLEGLQDGTPGLATLLLTTFRLLHLTVPPGSESLPKADVGKWSALVGEWSECEVDGVELLLCVASTGTRCAIDYLCLADSRVASASQIAAGHSALERLASSPLCQSLSSALLLPDHSRVPPLAAMAASRLLLLAAQCPPLGAALLPELQSTRLLGAVCCAAEDALSEAHLVAESSRLCRDLVAACCLWSQSPASPTALLALQTPALGTRLLAFLQRLAAEAALAPACRGLRTTEDDTLGVFTAADWWFRAQVWRSPAQPDAPGTDSGSSINSSGSSSGGSTSNSSGRSSTALAPRTPAALPRPLAPPAQAASHSYPVATTAEQIGSVVASAGRHPTCLYPGLLLTHTLWRQMDSRQQGRAFTAVATLAQHILRASLPQLTPAQMCGVFASCNTFAGDAGHGRTAAIAAVAASAGLRVKATDASAAVLAAIAEDADGPLSLAYRALSLLHWCVTPPSAAHGQGLASSGPGGADLLPRARWLLVNKAVPTAEALLRATPDWFSGLGGPAFSLAVSATAPLLGTPHAPVAVSALLPLTASMRKHMHGDMSAMAAQRRRDLADGDTAAAADYTCDIPAVWGSIAVLHDALRHGVLLSRCEDGCAAALLVRRTLLLQLLPATVRGAVALIAARPRMYPGSTFTNLVSVVAAANAAGMAGLTAAAGAPRLIHDLLAKSQPADYSSASACYQYFEPGTVLVAAAALLAAGDNPAWCAAARLLKLRSQVADALDMLVQGAAADQEKRVTLHLEGVTELGSVAPALLARVWPPGTVGDLTAALRRALQETAPQVGPADGACAVEAHNSAAAALERSTMQAAASGGGGRQTHGSSCTGGLGEAAPFFGCWDRRCLNLEGDSESSLKTRACGGCLLAT